MALAPDVTPILYDPELGAQSFTIRRKSGKWERGRLQATVVQEITAIGNIQPPSSEQLVFFPEGERRKGERVIYTTTLLHLSEGEEVADDIIWRGEEYKVIRVDRWDDWGFNIAYAAKR